jgi:hypothetical protein
MSLAAGTALAVTVSAGRPELAHAEDAVVEIAEAVWTDNVTDADRTYATRFADSVLLRPPLYFWTRVNGRSEALAKLRSEGKLPIRHEWQQLLGPKWIWDNDGEPLDAIALSVGREEKLAQLQRELQNRHFFDWRTWSKKDNLTRGWWRVSVKYANGDDVMCAGDPCRYMIKVK